MSPANPMLGVVNATVTPKPVLRGWTPETEKPGSVVVTDTVHKGTLA